ETVMRAAMSQPFTAQAADDDLEGLVENLSRIHERNPVIGQLERRNATADADFQTAVAELIEHADLTYEPQGIVEREKINQRSQMDLPGTLRCCGQEDSRRWGHSERRRMMLGDVVAVKSCSVVFAQ